MAKRTDGTSYLRHGLGYRILIKANIRFGFIRMNKRSWQEMGSYVQAPPSQLRQIKRALALATNCFMQSPTSLLMHRTILKAKSKHAWWLQFNHQTNVTALKSGGAAKCRVVLQEFGLEQDSLQFDFQNQMILTQTYLTPHHLEPAV